MKYRQEPSDFIVKEVASHKVLKSGKYKLYTLEKEDTETFGLLEKLSKIHEIPRHEIGIAGIKDTYAKTRQYMTVPAKYELSSIGKAVIEFVGYVSSPIKLGDLLENKFIITVKEVESYELDYIIEKVKSVNDGIPNYFDSQRFGSVVDGNFIGRFLVKKDYEGAVKQYLTSFSMTDSEDKKVDRENILNSWPRFDIDIKDDELKRIIDVYKKTKKWIVAYKHIPANLRQMFISSYQSYLWNECVKLLLVKKAAVEGRDDDIYSVTYAAGELVFSNGSNDGLPKTFQTISHRIEPKEYEKEIIDEVLAKEGLKISDFNIRQTGNFFKTSERTLMLYPKNFHMQEPVKDGSGKSSVTVSFNLSKGSYATMVLKKVFGK